MLKGVVKRSTKCVGCLGGINLKRMVSRGYGSAARVKGIEVWRRVVKGLHGRYLKEVPMTREVEGILRAKGWGVSLDHGATRVMTKEGHEMTRRVGSAMGLSVRDNYEFAEKKLTAFDMQAEGEFKWFSTRVKWEEMGDDVKRCIGEDNERHDYEMKGRGEELLSKLERQGDLGEEEAREFEEYMIYEWMRRQGKPVKMGSLSVVGRESQEAVNAMLLGVDFNHVAYCVDDIEALEREMKGAGYEMLPEIQGGRGTQLRQTSVMADKGCFPVELWNGDVVLSEYPRKFIEFIQRDGYQGFKAENAAEIFNSTNGVGRA